MLLTIKARGFIAKVAMLMGALAWMPAYAQDTARPPVQWIGNGHFYQVIQAPSNITWDDSQAYATSHGGYLATITSDAENSFVFSLIDDPALWKPTASGVYSKGPWLGGFQPAGSPEPDGGWQWVNNEGPITTNVTYTNWNSGEPNDDGDENRLSYIALGKGNTSAKWSDSNNNRNTPITFIVEYDNEATAKAAPIGSIHAGPPASMRPLPTVASGYENQIAGLETGFTPIQPDLPPPTTGVRPLSQPVNPQTGSPGNNTQTPQIAPIDVARHEQSTMQPLQTATQPMRTQELTPATAESSGNIKGVDHVVVDISTIDATTALSILAGAVVIVVAGLALWSKRR